MYMYIKRPEPIYKKIKRILKAKIEKGQFKPGDKLPSERVLSEECGVNRLTVNKAVSELAQEGLIHRLCGKGTFVTGLAKKIGIKKGNNKKKEILFLVPQNARIDFFTGPILEAVRDKLNSHGKYSLGVNFFQSEGRIELESFVNERVSGIIVLALKFSEYTLPESIKQIPIPIVFTSSHEDIPVDYVAFDNTGGAIRAVEYLISLGHEKIAFLAGPKDNISANERLLGYENALAKHGLENNRTIIEGDWDEENGYKRMKKLLMRAPRPTAIFTASDSIAAGAIKAIHESHIKVPDDISVVGFGDFPVAKYIVPGLTTVSLPLEEMGKSLIELLIFRMKGGENRVGKRIKKKLKTKLVVRKSAGDCKY
ncbi:MAG: GntR family transcriptional regulator [bacterium]